jgi:hypothetical protein
VDEPAEPKFEGIFTPLRFHASDIQHPAVPSTTLDDEFAKCLASGIAFLVDEEKKEIVDALGLTAEGLRQVGWERAEDPIEGPSRDREAAARLSDFGADHPELRAMAEAQVRDSEVAAVELLPRED